MPLEGLGTPASFAGTRLEPSPEEEAVAEKDCAETAVVEADAEAFLTKEVPEDAPECVAKFANDCWGDGDAELTASEREITLPRLRLGACHVGTGRPPLVGSQAGFVLRPRTSAFGLGVAEPLEPPAIVRSTSAFSIADGSADECPICLAEPTRRTVLPCGHGYCTDCLLESIAEYGYRRCFLCRGPLFEGQVAKPTDRDASPLHTARQELDGVGFSPLGSENILQDADSGPLRGGQRSNTVSGVLLGWFYYLHCSQLHWARPSPEERVGAAPPPSTSSSSRLSLADSPRSGLL